MNPSGYVRTPTIADDRIVFACEDDLWIVGAEGGLARRLTTMEGECSLPRLSPDGARLAFVGRDEGHPELYVMASEGGVPVRLTHLGGESLFCSGWSSDGRTIYITSDAGSPFVKETHAFAVDAEGGEPVALPLGHALSLDVAANGATLLGRNAFDPARWKRYRGGTAGHLWVDATGRGTFERICRNVDGNLVWPMWLGARVLFLSDHEGVGNLYSVLPDGSDLRRHTHEREHYVRFPASDGTRVVYACGGELVILDPRDGSTRRVPVDMPSNAPETARRFVDAGELLEYWMPSHDGTALAIVSRGRAFTMPLWEEAVTEYGDDAAADYGAVRRRFTTWMHDDKRIAYVDDATGFERIAIAPIDQSAPAEYLTRDDHGVLHSLAVSPAGDRIAFATNRYELWLLDAGSAPRKVDTSVGERIDDLTFSPDGKWLAYVWSPKAHTTIVRLVECATGRIVDATSPLREDRSPAWDPEGKYLYFISTRDFHPVYDALQFELSFPEASRPYLVTLRDALPNPFIPKPAALHKASDDDDKDDDDKKDAKPDVEIDAEGLPLRMIAFPVEEGAYDRIAAAKGRAIFSRFPVRGIRPNSTHDDEAEGELQAYDFEEQRSASLALEIDDFVLGPDARTLVYASRGKLRAIDAGADLPEDGPDDEKQLQDPGRRSGWLDLGRISVLVEPAAEWRQMLREAWRLQRENFWDAGMSGVDWDAVLTRYEALLPKVRTRAELSDVIWEMQGELGTSHAYETGGDRPIPPQYKRGFLGAELAWNAGLGGYRIEKILRGDPWNRDVDSPLAEAGSGIKEGDTILAIGGRRVDERNGAGALLVNQAGRDVTLTVVRAKGDAPRRVLVRTLRDERMLRYRAWVDANRARVHGHSGGRIGYVHIPDMGPWGFAEFHRGYLSEFDRDALIIDVRYNRGGHVSALLLEKLARKRVGYDVSRWAPPSAYPEESVAGPMVAVTNQFAGSDGDIFSHCFKLYGLGPLVGMRTWGGVIGIHPRHRLVDGTETTQPEFSFWFTDAGWGVENYGTDPTHEVDVAPQDTAAGRDPQLDEALRLIDEALAKHPGRPAFPPRPNRAVRR